jgi:hypothetical protein
LLGTQLIGSAFARRQSLGEQVVVLGEVMMPNMVTKESQMGMAVQMSI